MNIDKNGQASWEVTTANYIAAWEQLKIIFDRMKNTTFLKELKELTILVDKALTAAAGTDANMI